MVLIDFSRAISKYLKQQNAPNQFQNEMKGLFYTKLQIRTE